MVAEGTYSYDWQYVVQGGRWVRTIYYRTFPDRNNVYVYDVYMNGRYTGRRDERAPRPTPAPPPQEAVQIQRLTFLLAELRKAVANSQPMMPANTIYPGMTGTIGGMQESFGNFEPLTALGYKNQGTPAGQFASGMLNESNARGGATWAAPRRY